MALEHPPRKRPPHHLRWGVWRENRVQIVSSSRTLLKIKYQGSCICYRWTVAQRDFFHDSRWARLIQGQRMGAPRQARHWEMGYVPVFKIQFHMYWLLSYLPGTFVSEFVWDNRSDFGWSMDLYRYPLETCTIIVGTRCFVSLSMYLHTCFCCESAIVAIFPNEMKFPDSRPRAGLNNAHGVQPWVRAKITIMGK